MKIVFYDLETTGVPPHRHGIHQISGLIDIDGKILSSFNFNVKPIQGCEYDPDALEVCGKTKEEMQDYDPMPSVHKELLNRLGMFVDKYNKQDKYFLCGYNNTSFDNQFFRGFFLQNKDNYFGSWFWSNSFDVMTLATMYLMHERQDMPDFKLVTVAKKLGIEVDEDKLHDALYDVEITRKMFYKIVGNG